MTVRVGILTYDFYPFMGGQGRLTHDLWRRLRERDDIDVEVISPARNSLPGHHTKYAYAHRAGCHPLFSLLATASVRRWRRDLRLDVLHVNGGPGGVLLARDPGAPVVYSLYHTYAQVARLMPGHRWKAPAIALERRAYGRATALVGSTASTIRSLHDDIGLTAAARVIPCGVDFDAFPDRPRGRDEDTVLFVGRLDPRKNPALLVRAFAIIARTHASARLVLVGGGALEAALRRLVRALDIEGRVSFERFVSHDALVRWYQRAAVVVVPSLFEGFGLSAVEAQACGGCVVATDSEGLQDVIIDGETGVLSTPTPGALASEVSGLLADPDRRHRLGRHAAAHVRAVYAWPAIVDEFADTYHQAARQL